MFGGGGAHGTGEFLGSLGFGPAVVLALKVVAIFTVLVPKGFFNTNGGYEFPLIRRQRRDGNPEHRPGGANVLPVFEPECMALSREVGGRG